MLKGKLVLKGGERSDQSLIAVPDLAMSLEYGDKISELIEEIKRIQDKLVV